LNKRPATNRPRTATLAAVDKRQKKNVAKRLGVIVPSDVTYSEIVASPGRQALARHADRTRKVVGHHRGGAQVDYFTRGSGA
jgi:hypothetical protein